MNKRIFIRMCLLITIIVVVGMAIPAQSATIAYWRFEEGPAGAQVPKAKGGFTYEKSTLDSSGHSYDLSVWDTIDAGYVYRRDVPVSVIPKTGVVNNFCVKNSGGVPGMWTNTNDAINSITPAAWTIEISIKPENGGYRTFVGRDSQGTSTMNPALSALYFQAMQDNALAIKFCDVTGVWHQAVSETNVFQGFDWASDPDGLTGKWYNLAAVSDGTILSLYLDDVSAGTGYKLIAQTDMTGSSTNTALTAGAGDGSDWGAGNWTVGRGLFEGVHKDRGVGYIDEIRISDTALSTNEFLFVSEPTTMLLFGFGSLSLLKKLRS